MRSSLPQPQTGGTYIGTSHTANPRGTTTCSGVREWHSKGSEYLLGRRLPGQSEVFRSIRVPSSIVSRIARQLYPGAKMYGKMSPSGRTARLEPIRTLWYNLLNKYTCMVCLSELSCGPSPPPHTTRNTACPPHLPPPDFVTAGVQLYGREVKRSAGIGAVPRSRGYSSKNNRAILSHHRCDEGICCRGPILPETKQASPAVSRVHSCNFQCEREEGGS